MGRELRTLSITLGLAAALLGGLMVPAAQAACTGPSVAVMGAEDSTPDGTALIGDVVSKLTATCRFSSVTAVDIWSASPSLSTLQAYDVALVWTDDPPASAIAFGDTLADYVDAGHRLVVAEWGFQQGGFDAGLYGRIVTGNYLPFTTSGDPTLFGGPFSLVPDVPASPLLAGVSSFGGGALSCREPILLASGATQVAHWSDGPSTPLEAVKGNVVGLNLYPPSSDATGVSACSPPPTDGAVLLANALISSLHGTDLSIKAPRRVPAGTRAKVKGSLTSDDASCTSAQLLSVKYGTKNKTVTTGTDGSYSFAFKIKKKTRVKVSYAGNTATCSASSARRVIRVA